MRRRKFLSLASTSFALASVPALSSVVGPRTVSETVFGASESPLSEADIKTANRRALKNTDEISAQSNGGDAAAMMPSPVTGENEAVVGYRVAVDSSGHVDYLLGSVSTGRGDERRRSHDTTGGRQRRDSEATTGAASDERTAQSAVEKVHEGMKGATDRTDSARSGGCFEPSGLFSDATNLEAWTDQWGCPDTSGRRVTIGEAAGRDQFTNKDVERAYGQLFVDEYVFRQKRDGEQLISTLSEYELRPGEAIDEDGFKHYKLEAFEPTHDYGVATRNEVRQIEGAPTYKDEAPSDITGFSMDAGVTPVSIDLSWSNEPDEIQLIKHGHPADAIRWEHTWAKTQATPTVFAASAARVADEFADGEKVLRTEAEMDVIAPTPWYLPLPGSHGSLLTAVEYYVGEEESS